MQGSVSKKLLNFYKFIAGKTVSEKIRISIINVFNHLKDNPLSGQLEDNLIILKLNHRRIVKDNYKIIYMLSDKQITITDIFDTRRNPDEMNG